MTAPSYREREVAAPKRDLSHPELADLTPDQVAQDARHQFLAAVSHELRTPLTALAGYGELLADEILGPLSSLQLDTVERMRAATHQLTVIIDEVLTFSRLETGAEKAVLSELSPRGQLQDTAATIEAIAHKKGIALVIEPSTVAGITSDHVKIQQILMHLADNAVKFTKEGSVRLSVTEHGKEVRFSVADTGIGIAPEHLDRIFIPFMQVDGGLTRRHAGIGLGLYIAKRLATLLGGRIEVQSELGAGSVFSLIIPRGPHME